MDQSGTVVQVGVHASSISMNFPTQMELKLEMFVAVISGMLAALQIGQTNFSKFQSTNFPGQLDRASATFPLIMYYAMFHHLFLWVVQGSRTVFKTRQFKRLNNASNKNY